MEVVGRSLGKCHQRRLSYRICGKSFIATQMLKDVDKNSIYVAFNKSIAEEMKEKITNEYKKVYYRIIH